MNTTIDKAIKELTDDAYQRGWTAAHKSAIAVVTLALPAKVHNERPAKPNGKAPPSDLQKPSLKVSKRYKHRRPRVAKGITEKFITDNLGSSAARGLTIKELSLIAGGSIDPAPHTTTIRYTLATMAKAGRVRRKGKVWYIPLWVGG
jgi:hypothetical protein